MLTIGERQGSYEGMPESRRFNIVKVGGDKHIGFSRDARGKKVEYDGHSVDVVI